MSLGAPGQGRVVASHQIARGALRWALFFALVAAGWSVHTLITDGVWWGPLHAFLAGTVLMAISGLSQMFTITWSSTVPPPLRSVLAQRWAVVGGVGSTLLGVGLDIPLLIWLGGIATFLGVALLAWIIHASVRRSLLRRFDLSARFYLVAFAAGLVGISLGTAMAAGVAAVSSPSIRLVHAHLNLVGLVGLTIIGTIPTLLPTTAYSRAVSGREAQVGWWMASAGVAGIGIGVWIPELVGAGTIAVALAFVLMLGGILRRLWSDGRGKLAFLQISTGSLWLIGWGLTNGAKVVTTGAMAPFSGWTAAAVLAGVGQVLAGSLAYLVPVLRGSPFELNRHTMNRRGWVPLMSLNTAALCLGSGIPVLAVLLLSLWILDFGIRLAQVSLARPS